MPTRDELYAALRNADKTGDSAGARKLAAYINALPAEEAQTPVEAKESPGMLSSLAAGAGKGLGDVVLGAQSLIGKGLRNVGAQSAGDWLVNDARAGQAKLAAELAPYKNANPVSAGAGEITGNIVGTLPVGAGLGAGIRAVAPGLARVGASAPALQRLATSVETGGFRTGAPVATNALGRASNLATRAAGGAVSGGAAAGIINPDDAVSGAVTGALLPPALAGAGKAAGYAGSVSRALTRPFTEKGQNRLAADIIKRFGEGAPINIDASEIVPGSMPTLAEATGNAGIAGLQRVARDLRVNAFDLRERASAGARNALFDNVAGNEAMVAAAKAGRDSEANALYGNAFRADDMRQALASESQQTRAPFSGVGLSGAREDLSTPGLRALMTRPGFKAAAAQAKTLAADNGVRLDDPLQSLQGLHYIKLALDDQLNPMAATALGKNASAAVMEMRDKLAEELGNIAPLYNVGRQRFAEMSQPINAMETLQGLKLTNGAGDITLSKVKTAIENIEKARKQPGIAPEKSLNQDQLDALYALQADLRRKDLINAGRSAGSNTFQNISTNNILATALPGQLGELAVNRAGGIVGQVGRLAYSGPNEAIRNRLADMMLDPAMAKAALEAAQESGNPNLQRFLRAAGQGVTRAAPLIGVAPEQDPSTLVKQR